MATEETLGFGSRLNFTGSHEDRPVTIECSKRQSYGGGVWDCYVFVSNERAALLTFD